MTKILIDEATMKLALEAAYLAGWNASGEGYNAEYPFGDHARNPEEDAAWIKDRDNALRGALAEQPAPKVVDCHATAVQEGVLARKWILHGSFADVASFDSEGVPSFYWKESIAKFQKGQLSAPCKGKNYGSLNGWLHSAECRAEHEAQYTAPQAQRTWVGLTDELRAGAEPMFFCGAKWAERILKEKNT